MSSTNGRLFVIEGTDGTGKSTQYDLLHKRLVDAGHDVVQIHFPRYNEPSSYFVREYLNGAYGAAEQIGPFTASLFYALDRYQAATTIREALAAGKIVLCDRYNGSNMAHQGAKFANAEERRNYFVWADNLEFGMLRIPRPDYNFVLTAPYEVVAERLNAKANSSKHVRGKDAHEADPEHIRKSLEAYNDVCSLFPKYFGRIDAIQNNQIADTNTISDILWQAIQPMLPEPNTKTKAAKVKGNQYVAKNEDGVFVVTPSGHEYLKEIVTNTDSNVYSFTGKVDPMTVAAAMARLSRRGDDMRITILDEFTAAAGKDEKLLQRVITAYGDDSVQQLVGQYIVVEEASNLLTKKLEWGRLAAYLEQSTRYIYFDQKDKSGKYKYYTPEHFEPEVKNHYDQVMDRIFDLYSSMVHSLTEYIEQTSSTPMDERDIAWKGATRAQACDAVRPVLPVATKSTVGIYGSGQALESLIMHLLSDELPEAQETGQKILDEARKVIPTFLERADKPDRGGATIAYRANTYKAVQKLAQDYLPPNYSPEVEPVQLTSFWPKNEIDLVPDMLYEHSSLALNKIAEEVEGWDYNRKMEVFEAYIGERLNRRHKPGRALEKAHYSWDLVCDYGIFRDLQRHRMVDDLEWQFLTPRYGYEVPKLIEDANLVDDFEQCFDLSLELHSYLQQAGLELEAQYATLLGHKMRWKLTYNAREAFHLHELRTSPQGHPGYRKLIQQMHEKLAEVHPTLADSMIFVNKGEDEELTRLAAEKYTQFKLQQLN